MLKLFSIKEKKEKYRYSGSLSYLSEEGFALFETPLPQEIEPSHSYRWDPVFKVQKINSKKVELTVTLERWHWTAPEFKCLATLDRSYVRFTKEEYLNFITQLKENVLPKIHEEFTINLESILSIKDLYEMDFKINNKSRPWLKAAVNKEININFYPYKKHSRWMELKVQDNSYLVRFEGHWDGKANIAQWNFTLGEVENKISSLNSWITSSFTNLWDEF